MERDGYPKVWRCPKCKAELGQVTRSGSGVRKLVVGAAEISGEARVWCECGAARLWVPGEEHLREILERRKKWHER